MGGSVPRLHSNLALEFPARKSFTAISEARGQRNPLMESIQSPSMIQSREKNIESIERTNEKIFRRILKLDEDTMRK